MYYHRTTLYRILDSFLRHKWLFVITVSSILMLTVGYTVLKPTTYTAAYTVIVGTSQTQNPLGSTVADPWSDMHRIIDQMSAYVSTKEFIQAALTLPDGHPRPLDAPVDLTNESALVAIEHNIAVDNDDENKFTVTLSNYPNADDTKTILTSVINEYIHRDAQERAANYTAEKVLIANQVQIYHDKLVASEKRITDFKRQSIANLPGQEEAKEQELISLKGQFNDLSIQIASAEDRIKYSKEQIDQTPKTIVSSTISAPTDTTLSGRLADLQQQLEEARQTMNDNHPVVINLKDRIQVIQHLMAQEKHQTGAPTTNTEPNPLYESLYNQYVETQIDLKTLERQQSEVSAQIGTAATAVSIIPAKDRELAEITRDYNILTDTYTTLKHQLQVATLNEEINLRNETDLYQTMLTSPPASSASTKKLAAVYIGGFILAFFLGAALVMLVEWSDRSFRDPSEAEKFLNIPILAVLPEIEAPKGQADITRRLLPTPDTGPGAGKPQRLLQNPAPLGASAQSASAIPPESGGKRSGWSPFRGIGDNQPEDLGS